MKNALEQSMYGSHNTLVKLQHLRSGDEDKIVFKILNGYEDIDRNILLKLKKIYV